MDLIDSIHQLKSLQLSAEYMHWITRSEPKHRVLEKLYTDLQEEIDHLVECSLGSGLIHVNVFESRAIHLNLDQDILDQIINTKSFLNRAASQLDKEPEIQDIVYDIMNTLNKITYLLTLS